MKESTVKSSQIFFGALLGLTVGAIAGILFAPAKGAKTRKQIMDKGEEYADALQGKFDHLVESISQSLESTRDEAEAFVSKGKAKFDDFKKDG